MKRFFSIILLLTFLFMGNTSFAYDESRLPTREDYNKLVEEGVLGESVTYEQFYELQKESLELEEQLGDDWEKITITRANASSYRILGGDIFVTNGTISSGLIGHAGIAINSEDILSTRKGEYPSTESLQDWIRNYVNASDKLWLNVYRYKYSTDALKAARWAERTYKGKKIRYHINGNFSTTSYTYCSKIVWQAYRYGIPKTNIGYPPNAAGLYAPISPLKLSYYINPTSLAKAYR